MNLNLVRLSKTSLSISNLNVRNFASLRDFFGSGKKKKSDEFQEDGSTTNEKLTLKTEFTSLADRSATRLLRKKAYKPSEDVEEYIKELCKKTFTNEFKSETYESLKLDDPSVKFKLLSSCIQKFDHNIPNTKLNDIKKISDLVDYYLTEQKDTSTIEEIHKQPDLPKNLHINLEYNRFDQKTDKFFNGLDAYPNRDSVVTSLWYSKKYKNIKKEKEYFSK